MQERPEGGPSLHLLLTQVDIEGLHTLKRAYIPQLDHTGGVSSDDLWCAFHSLAAHKGLVVAFQTVDDCIHEWTPYESVMFESSCDKQSVTCRVIDVQDALPVSIQPLELLISISIPHRNTLV